MWLKLDKEVYHRLNNITLPLPNGGSTQIDHVIVSVYGIFVIETKNYKGWIFGSEKQRQWTQVIMGRKYKFQNPLRQNYLHIKTLSELLGLEKDYFHSMIAFIGECELKTRDELPEHVLTSGMVSYVLKKQDKRFSEDDVKSIIEQIKNNRFDKSWKTNRQHKAYLKNKHSDKRAPSHNDSNVKTAQTAMTSKTSKTNAEPATMPREVLKSREVHRWSGQTQVAAPDVLTDHADDNDLGFITPFAVNDTTATASIDTEQSMRSEDEAKPTVAEQAPLCPTCRSEMIQRVAKRGARQGQTFYGCSQFPKCRGVVNKE